MKLKIKRKGYQTGGTVRLELLTPEQRTQYNSLPTGADKEAYYNSLIDKDGYINGQPTGDIVGGGSSGTDQAISAANQALGTAETITSSIYMQDSTPEKLQQQQTSKAINDGIEGVASSFGPVGQVISGVSNIANMVGGGIRESAEATNEYGELKDPEKAKETAEIGAIFSPWDVLSYRISSGDWSSTSGDKYMEHTFGKDYKTKRPNRISQMAQEDPDFVYREGMAEGGDVKGKGTGKSDSINTELPEGSFVVPVENAMVAQAIRDTYLPKQEGNMKKGGGVPVRLSNGEHVFTPEERAILEKRGIDLTLLAPNADEQKGNGYAPGTDDEGVQPPYKKPSMLEDTAPEDLGILTPYEYQKTPEEIAREKAVLAMANPEADTDAIYADYLAAGNRPAATTPANRKKEEEQNNALLNAYDALGGTTGLLSLAQLGTGIGTSLAHKRPKYELDTDFLNRVKDSVASEKYGLSPAEKEGLLTDLTLRERNLKRYASEISGGDAATAFAIAKDAQANTARSLIDVAAKDAEIMRQKKARTDALTLNKAGMGRQQFEDDLRAFDQNQMAAQKLIDAGISNFVGNKQYQDAQKKMDERLATYGTADFFNPEDYMKAYRAQYGNQ